MKSIMFMHPLMYEFGVRFLYFDGLKILKPIIGEEKEVFEPACGYGRIKRFISSTCKYSGIDLNERFVNYARRRNRDIRMGNILDSKNYKESDVIILSDILHHLSREDIRTLFSIAVRFAREKIVIVEPEFVTYAAKKNTLSRALGKFMAVMDYDGINEIEKWLSDEEYKSLFYDLKESNNIEKFEIKKFRRHYFVEMFMNENR
ncbi:MAG: class I SAM-dependent methyltransferase [Candidatus Aminicenantes bacterium]|nr:class I SAM-dependent methyltransferase [Candidatus Aminicenantes bacterium]